MTNIQLFSLSTNLFYLFLLKFCEEIFIVRDLVQIVLAFATQHEHPDPDQITENLPNKFEGWIRTKILWT